MSWPKFFRRAFLATSLALFLLLLPFSRSGIVPSPEQVNHAQSDASGCPPLPVHGPEQQVSFFVAPSLDRPGVMCSRLYNGTPALIHYGLSALGIERRWFGLVWSSVLHPKDLFSGGRGYGEKPVLRSLQGNSCRDFFFSSPYGSLHPGIYRVRFRYRATEQGKEQTIYSATVTIQ